MDGVEVRLLGPVEVVGPTGVVDLASASQRRLLAALALHAPQPVRTEWLAWVLGISTGALRKIVTRVRAAVGADIIVTTSIGYRLDAEVDASSVCRELERADGDPETLRCALDRWRGSALDEFRHEAWARGEATRLAEIRAHAVEDLAAALIQLGRPDEAIAVLEPHVVDNEFRDRPRGLLMRALAAAGRPTESLRSFHTYQSFLGERAGTEPSEELRWIEQRIATGWNGVERPEPSADPHAVPQASRPRSSSIPAPLVAGRPIVGRRRELEALVGSASDAEQGGSRIVLVSGESGIGKTSLMAATAAWCGGRPGWSVFYSRCTEVAREPFQPIGALLGGIVDALPEDEITAHAARCGGDLARIVPQLRSRVPEPTSGAVDDPGTARHQLFHAAADIARRAAAKGPLALLVDDLHWAESSGVELLHQLTAELAGWPVLLVAAFRDTGDAPGEHLRSAVSDLERAGATRLALRGLDADELGDLVRSRVDGAAHQDVGDVVELLEAETAGNPLFAEHLLRFWSESDRLGVGDTSMTLGVAASSALPATLRDLVWQRVGVLGPEARDVDDLAEPGALWLAGIVDSFTATMACRFRDAERCVGDTFAIGDRMGEPEAWSVFSGQTFVIGTFEGRHAELLSLVEPLMVGRQSLDITFRVAHAICCLEVGETGVPEALLREAIDQGLDTIAHDLIRSTTLLGYTILALDLGDTTAAALLLPEIEPVADEVSYNGVTSQGPVAAYVGKLLTLLGRYDDAEDRLLRALAVAESFGWEYHRASTLVALAHNRRAATGRLDATADEWLTAAEQACGVHGLASWARRAAALR